MFPKNMSYRVEPPPIRDGSLLCAQSGEVGAPRVDGFTARVDGTPRSDRVQSYENRIRLMPVKHLFLSILLLFIRI